MVGVFVAALPDVLLTDFAAVAGFAAGFSAFLGEDLPETDFFAGFAADFAVGFAELDDDLLADFGDAESAFPDFADEEAFAEAVFTVFDRSFSDFDLLLEAFFLSGLAI